MFDDYSIIIDGTPSFAAAECIIVRIVSHHWDIHEFVVSLGLFKKSLNGEQLASHIISSIINNIKQSLENMLALHMDRAKTNTSALGHIKKDYTSVLPSNNFCCSHGLNNNFK